MSGGLNVAWSLGLSDKVVSMPSVRRSVLNFEHHHERANIDPTCHQHGFASAVHPEFCPTVAGALDSLWKSNFCERESRGLVKFWTAAALEHPTFPANPWIFRVPEVCQAAIWGCRSTHGEDLDLPQHSGESGSRHSVASTVPTLLEQGSLGTGIRKLSADYDSVASRTNIKETCADMDRETVVSSLFESVSKERKTRLKRCANADRQTKSP